MGEGLFSLASGARHLPRIHKLMFNLVRLQEKSKIFHCQLMSLSDPNVHGNNRIAPARTLLGGDY
jgi:hypothetical protein